MPDVREDFGVAAADGALYPAGGLSGEYFDGSRDVRPVRIYVAEAVLHSDWALGRRPRVLDGKFCDIEGYGSSGVPGTAAADDSSTVRSAVDKLYVLFEVRTWIALVGGGLGPGLASRPSGPKPTFGCYDRDEARCPQTQVRSTSTSPKF
jgi:hypothetical protein